MFPATSLPRIAQVRVTRALGCGVKSSIDSDWNSWQDSDPQPRRSKRRALPFELQEREALPIVDLRLPI